MSNKINLPTASKQDEIMQGVKELKENLIQAPDGKKYVKRLYTKRTERLDYSKKFIAKFDGPLILNGIQIEVEIHNTGGTSSYTRVLLDDTLFVGERGKLFEKFEGDKEEHDWAIRNSSGTNFTHAVVDKLFVEGHRVEDELHIFFSAGGTSGKSSALIMIEYLEEVDV